MHIVAVREPCLAPLWTKLVLAIWRHHACLHLSMMCILIMQEEVARGEALRHQVSQAELQQRGVCLLKLRVCREKWVDYNRAGDAAVQLGLV